MKQMVRSAEAVIVSALTRLRWGNIDITEGVLTDWLRRWAPEGLEYAGGEEADRG